jgi:two-component system response regulator
MQRFVAAADEWLVQVMLIEDDAVLRRAMVTFCRSTGIEVLVDCGDGLEALEALRHLNPDLILTDCQMPRMDGIALVRHLRARGDLTPVIMISGQQDAHIIDLARQAGVNLYLPKPLSTEDLRGAIGQTMPGWAA